MSGTSDDCCCSRFKIDKESGQAEMWNKKMRKDGKARNLSRDARCAQDEGHHAADGGDGARGGGGQVRLGQGLAWR